MYCLIAVAALWLCSYDRSWCYILQILELHWSYIFHDEPVHSIYLSLAHRDYCIRFLTMIGLVSLRIV